MSIFAFRCDNGKRIGTCPQLVKAGMSNIKPMEAPIETKKQIHVLVVDDEPEQRKMVGLMLRGKKCEITPAQSGKEALEILKTQKFDVIVLDYNMPNMTGPQLFELLTKEQRDIVIFNTGVAANTEELVRTGRPVLAKPYPKEQLHEAISSIAGPLE